MAADYDASQETVQIIIKRAELRSLEIVVGFMVAVFNGFSFWNPGNII